MGIRSRRRTRTPATNPPAPPASRHRRLDSGRDGHVPVPHDLPRSPERRDWAALPRDVLWVILSLVPQTEILSGAGLACASWWRVAVDEPLLWRRIDLATDEEEDGDPPAGWHETACAAVRRSAGRCESFRGRVDSHFLLFLANSAPSLRSLHVTSRLCVPADEFVMLAKKLPMLEQLVLSRGLIEQTWLAALVNHCPRLQLLDAGGCSTWCPINKLLRERLESGIKDLRLPRLARRCGGWWRRLQPCNSTPRREPPVVIGDRLPLFCIRMEK
ncbi:unnamed protein product [Alopecurus aequalis]